MTTLQYKTQMVVSKQRWKLKGMKKYVNYFNKHMTTNERMGKNLVDLFTYLILRLMLFSLYLSIFFYHSGCCNGNRQWTYVWETEYICACFAIPFNVTNAVALMHDADIWATVILVRLFCFEMVFSRTFHQARFRAHDFVRIKCSKIVWFSTSLSLCMFVTFICNIFFTDITLFFETCTTRSTLNFAR